jgi:hypothetical protein
VHPCELCGHVYAQRHRLKPGCWGGTYDPDNIVWLCPNHHAAVHLVMKWYYLANQPKQFTRDQVRRLDGYLTDPVVTKFFYHHVKTVVVERMRAEGRWHPYVRTLPVEANVRKRNRC